MNDVMTWSCQKTPAAFIDVFPVQCQCPLQPSHDIIILSPVDGYKDCVVLISPLASLFVSEMKKYFLIKLWPPPRCEIVSVSWTCSLLDVLRRNPV